MEKKYKILAKFNDIVIVPNEALDAEYRNIKIRNQDENKALRESVFMTLDGILVKLCFLVTWSTEYDDSDRECVKYFNMSFNDVKSVFYSRCNRVGEYWHKIRMIKV